MNDGKKRTVNSIMGRNTSTQPTSMDCDGIFITKPKEIANYLNNYFGSKVQLIN